jgi:hypothetical protein
LEQEFRVLDETDFGDQSEYDSEDETKENIVATPLVIPVQ